MEAEKKHLQYAVWIFRRTINAPEFVPTYNRAYRATPWCRFWSQGLLERTFDFTKFKRKITVSTDRVDCASMCRSENYLLFYFYLLLLRRRRRKWQLMAFSLSKASSQMRTASCESRSTARVLTCWIAELLLRIDDANANDRCSIQANQFLKNSMFAISSWLK